MENENSYYPLDPNSSVEESRLLRQDQLLTECISGFFPDHLDPAQIQRVLDIGCGPGGWLTELARHFPHMQLTGLDISEQMNEQARKIAEVEHFQDRLRFLQGNFARLPHSFENAFDFINARLVQWFVDQGDREMILQGWFRALRPGGWLRLTEAELPITNSPASELLADLFLQVLQRQGKTLIPASRYQDLETQLQTILHANEAIVVTPRNHGISLLLRQQLERLGCVDIHLEARCLDYSAGAPAHDSFVQDLQLSHISYRAFLLASFPGLLPEQLDQLNTVSARDMRSSEFMGIQFYLNVWGQKPF